MLTETRVWRQAGTFQFCVWLTDEPQEAGTPIAQTITFRRPTGAISASLSPTFPVAGSDAELLVTGASESPTRAFATIQPGGGAGCPPTPDSGGADVVIDGSEVNGAFSLSQRIPFAEPGPKLVCLWLTSSATEATPVAGPQPLAFTVVAKGPPPPSRCVVPAVAAGTRLGDALEALRAASCSAGSRSSAPSRFAGGTVIASNPAAGATLPAGAAVTLTVSDGRPCVVPGVRRGVSRAAAARRLRAAGCTVGRTVLRRHRSVARGRVLGTAARAGSRHAPRARIALVVSRGRR